MNGFKSISMILVIEIIYGFLYIFRFLMFSYSIKDIIKCRLRNQPKLKVVWSVPHLFLTEHL